MKYRRCYEGGPADGGDEESPAASYPTLTGKSHLAHGLQIVAIYEYQRTEQDANVVRRFYRYRESLSRSEAAGALDHTQWQQD